MNFQTVLALTAFGAAFLGLNIISAFPDGAPEESCNNMRPSHEVRNSQAEKKPLIEPQTETPYYSIHVNKVNVNLSEDVLVTIIANKLYYEGFLIQARDVNEQASDSGEVKKYGTFTVLNNKTQTLCNQQAVTHAAHEHFTNLTMKWTAPNITVKNIHFKATVVKGYSTFFLNVHSEILNNSGANFQVLSLVLLVFIICFTTGLMNI